MRSQIMSGMASDLPAIFFDGYDLSDAALPDADTLRARLVLLDRADASFLVAPAHRAGPIADPRGLILGAATATLHTIAAHNRELRITGLPAGYVL